MNLKQLDHLRERRLRLGTWLSVGSPVIAELAAECRFDWLLFDLEHGCGTEAAVLPQLQSIGGTRAAGIVRVGAPNADLIARLLDWGADGIMVPRVSSLVEAEACARAMRYAPHGQRGFSRTVRAYGYGLRPPGPQSQPAPLLFVQIETIEGVENAHAIAAIDGVDVLFIGPADLQFDLQARPALVTRDYAGCLQEVASAAGAAGKLCGLLLRNLGELEQHRALGFTHIAIDSDLAMLRSGFQQIVSNVHGRERA